MLPAVWALLVTMVAIAALASLLLVLTESRSLGPNPCAPAGCSEDTSSPWPVRMGTALQTAASILFTVGLALGLEIVLSAQALGLEHAVAGMALLAGGWSWVRAQRFEGLSDRHARKLAAALLALVATSILATCLSLAAH